MKLLVWARPLFAAMVAGAALGAIVTVIDIIINDRRG